MTKTMFALHGDVGSRLLDPATTSALADAGATRVQLNLDDAPVAAALRLATGAPITAVVSAWDGDVAAVLTVLTALDPDVLGWEVDEHRPIEPPEVWDGSRVEALANVALLRRPADLTVEQWRERWLVDHTPVAIATQATFGYVQNVVVAALNAAARADPPVAALVEELFGVAALTDVHAFYGSAGDDAELSDRIGRLMASCARFGADRDLDLVPTGRYLVRLSGVPEASTRPPSRST